MQFTFGIITNNNHSSVNLIIDSIEKQNIPEYEIILVGIENIKRKHTQCIFFNENAVPGWITKKKNLITHHAKYENIVYMHDYIVLEDNWYNGFLTYDNNFDIIINKINNSDGSRFRDWILNIDFLKGMFLNVVQNVPTCNSRDIWTVCGEDKRNKLNIPPDTSTIFLDYNDDGKKWQKYIYLSGAYFICKKHVMMECPLNENLLHCQGEDVEWSQRVRTKYQFKFNKYSSVKLLKYKYISNFFYI
jgi:hypothetical protein